MMAQLLSLYRANAGITASQQASGRGVF